MKVCFGGDTVRGRVLIICKSGFAMISQQSLRCRFLGSITFFLFTAIVAPAAVFFVAVDGDDSWSGTLPKANIERTDGPFASIGKAQEAVRRIIAQGFPEDGIRVDIAGGVYVLKETIKFGKEDSGQAKSPVHYRAAEGETVTIVGSVTLSDFVPYRANLLKAAVDPHTLSGQTITGVFYKGQKQHRSRVPDFDPENPIYGGFAFVAADAEGSDTTALHYDPDVVAAHRWKHPEKAMLDIFPGYNYGNRRVRINGIDTENNILHIDKIDYKPLKGDRYYIENVFEELNAPGEWYFDDSENVLYFYPPNDGTPFEGRVSVPVLDTLFLFEGARHIQLKGLDVRNCKGTAIVLKRTDHCMIAGCTISNTGQKAIELLPESRHNRIISNNITRTGDYAIMLTAGLFKHDETSRNIISNNHIYNFGTVMKEIAGIAIFGGGDNVISHNLIHHGPRWGVWINSGARNIVEYNHIHHMSLETEDTGAVYMATNVGGWEPNMDVEKNKLHRGNIIRYNRIHDTLGYGMTGWWTTTKGEWSKPYYSWSIYLDLAVSGTHIHGNICYNSHLGGVAIGGGKDNIVENNIFVDGQVAQLCTIKWDPSPPNPDIAVQFPPSGNRFERNIISYVNPDAALYWFVYQYGSAWKPSEFSFNRNIIHHRGDRIKFEAAGLENPQWQNWLNRGMDADSVIADPMFKDADSHDYRLNDESPAFQLGFKPIPVERIGLYKDVYRKTLPCETNGDRKQQNP